MRAAPTILLVEDNESDILLLSAALKQGGVVHSLQVARDGDRAIQYLGGVGEYADRNQYPMPGLVLLDLGLPGKSGFDVLEWITHHAAPSAYAVVVLTGSRRPEDVVRADELGARLFLVKPDSLNELINLVGLFTEYLHPASFGAPSFEQHNPPVAS